MGFLFNVIAILIAAVAVFYSRKAVSEAKVQNEVARFEKKLGIYSSIKSFGEAIKTKGSDYPHDVLWEFGCAALQSEFYFPRNISIEFQRIHKAASQSKSILYRFSRLPVDPATGTGKAFDYMRRCEEDNAIEANEVIVNDCQKLSDEVRAHRANIAGEQCWHTI